MGAALVWHRELGPARYRETARVRFVRSDARYYAVVSEFDLSAWQGRAAYDGHFPYHRVALYDAISHSRLGVFDTVERVNDVDFHPTEPVVAIAAGSYDGGYSYSGELVAWNWKTGAWHRVSTDERGFEQCRFVPDGRLAVAVMPWTDEHDDSGALVLESLEPQSFREPALVDPARLGLDGDLTDPALFDDIRSQLRSRIWDMAVTTDGDLVVAHEDRIAVWSVHDGRCRHDIAVPGTPVELLARHGQLLVNVVNPNRSTLMVLDADHLSEVASFEGARTFSTDAKGYVLARNTARGTDQVLAPDGTVTLDSDLGHYDCFNHCLRIDGGEALYYLSGTPQESHLAKALNSITDGTEVRRVGPWDPEAGHHMVGIATRVGGTELVRSYKVYAPRGFGSTLIERWNPVDGRVIWRHHVTGVAHALVFWPALNAVAAALANGTLCVLDARTGSVLHDEVLAIDGARTIPTALAVLGDTLAVGTMTGHITLFRSVNN